MFTKLNHILNNKIKLHNHLIQPFSITPSNIIAMFKSSICYKKSDDCQIISQRNITLKSKSLVEKLKKMTDERKHLANAEKDF